jgi:hypothetical protein
MLATMAQNPPQFELAETRSHGVLACLLEKCRVKIGLDVNLIFVRNWRRLSLLYFIDESPHFGSRNNSLPPKRNLEITDVHNSEPDSFTCSMTAALVASTLDYAVTLGYSKAVSKRQGLKA